MALSPLDLFRFGELWRAGGLWNGEPVLSRAWIEASWTAQTYSPFSGDAYGYGWFLTEARQRRVMYARGYGGQMLFVVPSLGLTVVVTSDPTRPARSEGYVGDLRSLLADDDHSRGRAGLIAVCCGFSPAPRRSHPARRSTPPGRAAGSAAT